MCAQFLLTATAVVVGLTMVSVSDRKASMIPAVSHEQHQTYGSVRLHWCLGAATPWSLGAAPVAAQVEEEASATMVVMARCVDTVQGRTVAALSLIHI